MSRKLSVCCLTRDPAPQVAAILALFRDVADEIVVAVDFRVPVADLASYRGVADKLIRYEYAPPMERQLAWLHAQCSGDWIFRIDGDEVPSQQLLDELPQQIAARDVVQYWHPRRWLFPEPTQWLASPPWHPDFQLRLVRNDPATLWFPGVLHTSAAPVEPARFVEGPLYHLDTLTSIQVREAKAAGYATDGAELVGPSGYGPNTMYLPELFDPAPQLAEVPAADRASLEAVLAAAAAETPPAERAALGDWDTDTVVGRTEIDAVWAGGSETARVMGKKFYRASIEPLTVPGRMTPGSRQTAYVRVTNRGDRTWPGGVSNRPRVQVGYYSRDNRTKAVIDGYRVPFPAPVAPGGSTVVPIEITAPDTVGRHEIVLDVLHVYQRWFGPGLRVELEVVAGDAVLPTNPAELEPVPAFATTDLVVLLLVPDALDPYLPTLRSLRLVDTEVPLFVHAPGADAWRDRPEVVGADVRLLTKESISDALTHVTEEFPQAHVFLVSEPVILPPGVLAGAMAMAMEKRVASVSLFSNAAGFLSLPYRNTPVPHAFASIDEASVTKMLRAKLPAPEATPVPFATGPAVLLTRWALQGMASPTDETEDPVLVLADLTLQASRRGMLNLLDPGTFVFRAFDSANARSTSVLDDDARAWIQHRYPHVDGSYHEVIHGGESPLAMSHAVARTKILGLRVLIDGSSLGPQEMGTQVSIMSLVNALAERDDVATVTVALNGPVPGYAQRVLSGPSIQLRTIDLRDLSPVGSVDIAHRPLQPTDGLDLWPWREHAARTSVTILDLIGYNNGAYHPSAAEWLTYRNNLHTAVRQADGVVVIAKDVAEQMRLNRMPISPERVYPVVLGTDHLTGAPSTELVLPTQLRVRGFVAGRFIVALGTNYAHKNRDLALAAFEELRRKDPGLCLVLVGAYVPYGSSRVAETRLLNEANSPNVFTIADCTSAERNWLLRHAEVVLYATSAEGFGLVPYEAAQFGTPSVFVSFGPLREVAGVSLPVSATDWSPRSLADAVAALLYDPDAAAAQLAAVRAAARRFPWATAAERLVEAYRHMLSLPRR
ncbi:MAG: hypothetical protein QOI76_2487 [Frankiales bacterium]|nr:hypothetical protein [Frankiales bacterium]